MIFLRQPSFLLIFGVSLSTSLVGCGASPSKVAPAAMIENETRTDHQGFSELFQRASVSYHLPADLLAAIAYVETRWHPAAPEAERGDDGAHLEVFGVMGLQNSVGNRLKDAALAIGQPESEVKVSTSLNIEAAAALLSKLARGAGVTSMELGDWKGVLKEYSELPSEEADAYVREVFQILHDGVTENGIEISARPGLVVPRAMNANVATPNSTENALQIATTSPKPPTSWAPSVNFTRNGVGKPKYIVIHVTEGAFAGAVSWLRSAKSRVSAHYVIQSRDGAIKQLVQDQDSAWHARCWNNESIGIEHEGFISRPDKYFTSALYASSSKLVRYLTEKYSIPRSNLRIVGHNVGDTSFIKKTGLVDCNTHSDPGPGWNWTNYFKLITAL